MCTIISRTIEDFVLKSVDVSLPVRSDLPIFLETTATIAFEKKWSIAFDYPLKVTAVYIQNNQKISNNDLLFEVDVREYELALMQKELELLQLNNALKTETVLRQIEILEFDINIHKSKYPENGKIFANEAGVVYKVNIDVGETVYSGQSFADFYDSTSDCYAEFYLSKYESNHFDVSDNVSYSYSQTINMNGKNETVILSHNTKVERKEYDFAREASVFYISISDPSLYFGQLLTVKITHNTTIYDMVIPLSYDFACFFSYFQIPFLLLSLRVWSEGGLFRRMRYCYPRIVQPSGTPTVRQFFLFICLFRLIVIVRIHK